MPLTDPVASPRARSHRCTHLPNLKKRSGRQGQIDPRGRQREHVVAKASERLWLSARRKSAWDSKYSNNKGSSLPKAAGSGCGQTDLAADMSAAIAAGAEPATGQSLSAARVR